MSFAQVAGRPVYYERRGRGEPLLLIQGMAAHALMWGEPFVSRLTERFDVVSFDNRGIGESADVPGSFTVADLAEDTAGLMEALGWESAHVMGISLGGMIAQELALRHPRKVRTLILGCTWAGGPESTMDAPGPMEMFQAMQTGDIDIAIRAAFGANLSADYIADDTNFEVFRDASLARRVSVQTVVRQAQAAALHDTGARLGELRVPTLILHGNRDRMVDYSNAEHLARLIPNARLHTFDGVGHLFWWERPDETLELIAAHTGVPVH
jgi:pimeloyl-ACP methyl ester carboxylesterase